MLQANGEEFGRLGSRVLVELGSLGEASTLAALMYGDLVRSRRSSLQAIVQIKVLCEAGGTLIGGVGQDQRSAQAAGDLVGCELLMLHGDCVGYVDWALSAVKVSGE